MSNPSTQPLAIRFAIYTLAIFGFTFGLPFMIDEGDFTVFHEGGPVEWAQFTGLVATTLILGLRAWISPAFREVLLVLAALTAFAAIRELDAFLDRLLPVVGWKIGFLVLVYPASQVIAKWGAFRWQVARFLNSPAFPVLWAGFILAIPVAQLLGHGPLLKSLMGAEYDGHYKRIIEESGEIVGYLLLLAGAVESWFVTRNSAVDGGAEADQA